MGDVIELSQWRAVRPRRRGPLRVRFYFDLACPMSYVIAERVEREMGLVEWQPALDAGPGLQRGGLAASQRAAATQMARVHRVPLIWPETAGDPAPGAMRAAQYAAEAGAGAEFALAAGRLAYAGGFPLDCDDTLAEAAAAAGLDLGAVLDAAGESWRDVGLRATGRELRRAGVGALPAIRFGGVLLHGPDALERAAWLHRGRLPNRRRLADL